MKESTADLDILVPRHARFSELLRLRLKAADHPSRANDNLSAFIGPLELDALEKEVADRAQELLRALVIDTDTDPNTRDTARRVAKMFVREVFAGRYQPRPDVTEFDGIRHADECFAVGPIAIRSCCAHRPGDWQYPLHRERSRFARSAWDHVHHEPDPASNTGA